MSTVYLCVNPLCMSVFDRLPADLGAPCPKCYTIGVRAATVDHIPPPRPVGEEMPDNCPRRDESVHGMNKVDPDVWLVDGPNGQRTCSYCGGMHPEDVIRVLGEGWKHQRTDKSYKGYVEPPKGVRSSSPTGKFYIMHFTKEQIERLNVAIGAKP